MWQTGKCLYICEFLPPGPSYFCVFRPSVNGHVCKIRKLHEQPQKREIDEIFHVGAHAHMCARYEVSMIKPFNLGGLLTGYTNANANTNTDDDDHNNTQQAIRDYIGLLSPMPNELKTTI